MGAGNRVQGLFSPCRGGHHCRCPVGKGPTAEAAQKNAGYTPGVNLNKGFPILLGLGGYFGDEFVLDSLCTANAG